MSKLPVILKCLNTLFFAVIALTLLRILFELIGIEQILGGILTQLGGR